MDAAALEKIIDDLSITFANHFDPVRFTYIQSLIQRLANPKYAGNKILVDQASSAIQMYQSDLEERRTLAIDVVESIELNFPESAQVARTLYIRCEFKKLERLPEKLARQQAQKESRMQLENLVSKVNQSSETNPKSLSFDEVLNQQEHEVRVTAGYAEQGKLDGSGEQLELQSMKYLRESLKYYDIDKIIARAINEEPENPGPHNPHMLAVKSLLHMRNLSPQYLRRFAVYIETLLWLDKNSAKINNVK